MTDKQELHPYGYIDTSGMAIGTFYFRPYPGVNMLIYGRTLHQPITIWTTGKRVR